MTLFIQLSETEKRVIFALLIVIVLVFVLVALIGSLVVKTMKFQGKKLDTLVSDVITTRVITNKKQFFPYARKKNRQLFFKQSWLPLLFILVAITVLIIYDIINNDFSYNPFNKVNGFATLLFIFDFNDESIYTKVFGITVLADWPKLDPIYGQPQFVIDAWASYISVPIGSVGLIWYLVTAQSYLSRTIRMYKLSRTIFEKSLEGFNQNTPMFNNDLNEKNKA